MHIKKKKVQKGGGGRKGGGGGGGGRRKYSNIERHNTKTSTIQLSSFPFMVMRPRGKNV